MYLAEHDPARQRRAQDFRNSWTRQILIIPILSRLGMRSARSLAPRSSAHASAKQPASADSSVHPLIVHDKKEDVDVKFNSKFFPDLKVDDCVEIVPADRATTADAVGNRLVLRVSKEALAPQKGNFHVSLSSQLADLFAFRRAATRQLDVVVRTVTPETAALAFVEISFKDQHISRADMWRLKGALQGCALTSYMSNSFSRISLQFFCHCVSLSCILSTVIACTAARVRPCAASGCSLTSASQAGLPLRMVQSPPTPS